MRADPRNLLPPTGQTTSYDTGDDGEVEAGIPFSNRFTTDAAQNTVFDRATNLTWVAHTGLIFPQNTGKVLKAVGDWVDSMPYNIGDLARDTVDSKFYVCQFDHTASGTGSDRPAISSYWVNTVWARRADSLTSNGLTSILNFADSLANCEALDYNGFTDWRLPNVNELFTIIDRENTTGYYSGFADPVAQFQSREQTSTIKSTGTTNNMYVNFSAGGYSFAHATTTTQTLRPVRGGWHR